jgi:hypothetical protein
MARDQVLQLRATAEQRQLIDQAAAAEGISRTEFHPAQLPGTGAGCAPGSHAVLANAEDQGPAGLILALPLRIRPASIDCS